MSSDDAWEEWGRQDPYFGVISVDRFRRENLDEEGRREFFESGRLQVDHVLAYCRSHLGGDFIPRSVLDYGCGTGRLVIPFAERIPDVVAMDVSKTMLEETARNCRAAGVENVRLLEADDELSSLDRSFDLVHSFIVFQHVPVERGLRIFERLLDHLNPGGACVAHFTYAGARGMRTGGRFGGGTRRQRHDLRDGDPAMWMHDYPLAPLFSLAQAIGAYDVHAELTDHGGARGLLLFFRKPKA